MKKLFAILSIIIFLGTISATAIPISVHKLIETTDAGETGTFEGEIGYIQKKEWISIGEISGTYELKTRVGIIDGEWILTDKGISGTMKVLFTKRFLIGRITIDETGKKAPIIGFIGFKEETKQFGGRFMSLIGPAPYFQGTYQEG